MSLYNDEKLVALAFLLEVLITNDDLTSDELLYLDHVRIRLNVSLEKFDEVVEHPSHYTSIIITSEQQRLEVLFYILFGIQVDGVIDQRERKLVGQIGLRLGFRHEMVMDLIKVMETYIDSDIPSGAMIQTCIKYLN